MASLMKIAAFGGAVSMAAPLRDMSKYSFEDYIQEFGKSYVGTQHVERKALFEAQLAKVNKHNEEYEEGKHGWWAAVNEYSDWSDSEMATIKTGKAVHNVHEHPFAYHLKSAARNPSRKDWREEGVVSPVRDQGGCGSCWAFSAIEVVESHYMIAAKENNVVFAPQAYVNCVKNLDECGGTGGCDGATMELAFNMTRDRGVPLESDLPYKGRDGTCADYPVAAMADGYYKLPVNDAKALETAIATQGPVSVTVAANWGMYGGGIFEGGCKATACTLNHGVVAVGFDENYWLIRNSWGEGWGEQGYIRLSRTHDDETFEDNAPADGVSCRPYPNQLIVGGESGVLFDTSYPVNVRKVDSFTV